MSRPLKTHAGIPDRHGVPLCHFLASGAKPLRHGGIVAALNATCKVCQALLRIAALTPTTTEDTMNQERIDYIVQDIVTHVVMAVAMNQNPATPRNRLEAQHVHVAATLDHLLVETGSALSPGAARAMIDAALEKVFPVRTAP